MNEKTYDFLQENAGKIISIYLEFSVIYHIVTALTQLTLSEYTPTNEAYTLGYCVNSLICRTIDKFPQSANHLHRYLFDYYEHKDENEDEEDEDED